MLNIEDMRLRLKRPRKEWVVAILQLLLLIVLLWLITAPPKSTGSRRLAPSPERLKFHKASLEADASGRYRPDAPPISYVFLLKIPYTHADGVQNLLMRYALLNELQVALPRNRHQFFCFPLTFSRVCPENSDSAPFDMLFHSLRYNREEVSAVMFDDTKKVLLLRNPITLIHTVFYEAGWDTELEYTEFKDFVQAYRSEASGFDHKNHLPHRNIQTYLLGMELKPKSYRVKIEQVVDMVLSDFDVVLIQERLLESLVLLRFVLNWEYIDMVTFIYHEHPELYDVSELTYEVNETINNFNAGDKTLYDAMCDKLDQDLGALGVETVKHEMRLLKAVIETVKDECLLEGQSGVGRTRLLLSDQAEQDEFCQYSVADQKQLTQLFKQRDDKAKNKFKKVTKPKRRDNGIHLQRLIP